MDTIVTILHRLLLLLQFRLAYLNNHIELRHETFVLIDIYNDHGIGNLPFCKQCSSCKRYDRDIDGCVIR